MDVDIEQLLEHREFLTALARSLVADPLEQDELLWETLSKGATRPPRHGFMKPWLARVMRNRATDRQRSQQRRKEHERACASPLEVESAAALAARFEIFRKLVNHVQDLESDYQDVVLYRFFEDLPPREIAKRLDLPPATVKTRLKRALAMLRARLDHEHGSREKWLGSLLPMTIPSASTAGIGMTTMGVALMAMRTKVGLIGFAALLLLSAGIMYGVIEFGRSGEVEDAVEQDAAGALGGLPSPDGSAGIGKGMVAAVSSELSGASRISLETGAVGEIEGRVLDPLSDPVRDASLLLFRDRAVRSLGSAAQIVAKVMTDARGQFRMTGLDLGSYRLRVRAKGWAETQAGVHLSADYPAHTNFILRLGVGSSRSGVVVEPQGKLVAGAWVRAYWTLRQFGVVYSAEVRSDGAGRFTFAYLPTARVKFLAWSEGRMLGLAESVSEQSGPIRIVLPEMGPYELSFSLPESGQASGPNPEDVCVRILWLADNMPMPLPSPIRSVRVPSTGSISTQGLRAGTYQIYPESKDVALENTYQSLTLTEEEPKNRIDLAWAGHQGIEGRLVYETGEPAQGVLLRAEGDDERGSVVVRSNRQGRFAFPPRFSTYSETTVVFGEHGFLFETEGAQTWFVKMKPGERERVTTVLRSPSISGRVVDARGDPVPMARVWLHGPYRDFKVFGSARTNKRGQFAFSPSKELMGPLVLDAKIDSMYCQEPLTIASEGLSSRTGIVLRLVEGASIGGRVLNDRGKGVAGVRVDAVIRPDRWHGGTRGLLELQRAMAFRSRHAFSNRKGEFRIIGLCPGSWEVKASREGRERHAEDPIVTVARGAKVDGLQIVWNEHLTIQGQILIDKGKPLEGAWIAARFEGVLPKGKSDDWKTCQSGPDGRFTIMGLRAGSYKVQVQLPDALLRELGLPKPGTPGPKPMLASDQFRSRIMAGTKGYRWQITLPRFGEIRARLAQRGRPIQRIQVELRSANEQWTFDLPVLDGAVFMKRILGGSYDLRFKSPRFADIEMKMRVLADQVSNLGLLTLVPLDEVQGRVVDEDGHPVAGVWIGLDDKLHDLWINYDDTKGAAQFEGRVLTQSDVNGLFRVPVKGKLQIHAFKPGHAPSRSSHSIPTNQRIGIDAKPTRSSGLVLRLPRAGEVRIYVPPPPKNETSWWNARIVRIDGNKNPTGNQGLKPWFRMMRVHAGKPVSFLGIPPGSYRFQAADFVKVRSFSKKSVPGESYHEELQVGAHTKHQIRIP